MSEKKKKVVKPKPRPERKSGAVARSLRPKKRPDIVDLSPPEEADQLLVPKEKDGGKITKMGMGGKCRGMGAAGRGGAFTRNG